MTRNANSGAPRCCGGRGEPHLLCPHAGTPGPSSETWESGWGHRMPVGCGLEPVCGRDSGRTRDAPLAFLEGPGCCPGCPDVVCAGGRCGLEVRCGPEQLPARYAALRDGHSLTPRLWCPWPARGAGGTVGSAHSCRPPRTSLSPEGTRPRTRMGASGRAPCPQGRLSPCSPGSFGVHLHAGPLGYAFACHPPGAGAGAPSPSP